MRFQIAGGSVPGTDHTKPGQPGWTNNQDAFHWIRTDNCLVAIVCDGCGSGLHSEVGSAIGARLIAGFAGQAAEKYVAEILAKPEKAIEIDWKRVKDLTLSHISVVASAMDGSLSKTVNDYFLFTVVGAVITPWTTFLFSIGDGVFVVNGEVLQLGPFPNNAPPYLAYNLTGSALAEANPDLLNFKVNRTLPTSELQSLVLGCDGVVDLIEAVDSKLPHKEETVGEIRQFWNEDRYFENPDAVRRKLAIVNREGAEIMPGGKSARVVGGLLPDDTTLIVVRQNPNWNGEG